MMTSLERVITERIWTNVPNSTDVVLITLPPTSPCFLKCYFPRIARDLFAWRMGWVSSGNDDEFFRTKCLENQTLKPMTKQVFDAYFESVRDKKPEKYRSSLSLQQTDEFVRMFRLGQKGQRFMDQGDLDRIEDAANVGSIVDKDINLLSQLKTFNLDLPSQIEEIIKRRSQMIIPRSSLMRKTSSKTDVNLVGIEVPAWFSPESGEASLAIVKRSSKRESKETPFKMFQPSFSTFYKDIFSPSKITSLFEKQPTNRIPIVLDFESQLFLKTYFPTTYQYIVGYLVAEKVFGNDSSQMFMKMVFKTDDIPTSMKKSVMDGRDMFLNTDLYKSLIKDKKMIQNETSSQYYRKTYKMENAFADGFAFQIAYTKDNSETIDKKYSCKLSTLFENLQDDVSAALLERATGAFLAYYKWPDPSTSERISMAMQMTLPSFLLAFASRISKTLLPLMKFSMPNEADRALMDFDTKSSFPNDEFMQELINMWKRKPTHFLEALKCVVLSKVAPDFALGSMTFIPTTDPNPPIKMSDMIRDDVYEFPLIHNNMLSTSLTIARLRHASNKYIDQAENVDCGDCDDADCHALTKFLRS